MNGGRRTLVIFALIFLVLLALTLVQNRQVAEQPTPTPEVTFFRVFPDIAVLDIQAIRLRNPAGDESFTISRAEDGTWQAPEFEGTLDENAASSIARTMVLLPYTRTLPLEADTPLDTYGFQPTPVLMVEFILVTGEVHAVAVGFRTPSETGYYAIVDDRPDLYVLERAAVDFLILVLRQPPAA